MAGRPKRRAKLEAERKAAEAKAKKEAERAANGGKKPATPPLKLPEERGKKLAAARSKATASPAHARARARTHAHEASETVPQGGVLSQAKTRRQRVFVIAQLLAAKEWGPTVRQNLTLEWGISALTMKAMAAEASRLVDYTANDREQLVKICRVKLREIIETEGEERVYAVRTLLEHLGEMRTRQKVELGGPDGGAIPISGPATVVFLPAKEPLPEPEAEPAPAAGE